MTIEEAKKILAKAKRQLMPDGWVYKLIKPPDVKEIYKLLEEREQIVRCQKCRFGRKAYQLAGFVICTNRYSACHTSVIEDTFFCAKGEPKVGEQG